MESTVPARLEPPELLRRCDAFRKFMKWTVEEFLDRIPGLAWDKYQYSRNMSSPHSAKIKVHDLNLLTDFLDEWNAATDISFRVFEISGIEDHIYFSMLDFLRYSPQTEKETKELTVGLYRLYRPSLKVPNMYTVGAFNITESNTSGALEVEEIRSFKGEKLDPNKKYHAEGKISEKFDGYMIRKRRRYICFQRNQTQKSPNFLITVFNDEFLDGDEEARIVSLGGIAFGTSGSRMYISKVYIERCEAETDFNSLKNEIDYVTKENLRPSIVKNLNMPGGEPYYVF